ncbi:hypothetical protein [Candidatus Methylomirabilis sp.]|uniref:Uncharacterized protein n=1 Tax=Candidatus Methylomirabilis tolerans TaxID=3123416 RepID=A0AAJ1ES93_9BACT|nr:hypothetical protein [Candidatus Methylomirabilis sp.]
MIEESKADPVCIANATGKQDFTDNAEPCGAVECWDTVLRWISFETPATRWLASVQVPDPDSENVVESVESIQWTEKGDDDESATVRESL